MPVSGVTASTSLRPALGNAASVASPASTIQPEKSRLENLFARAFHMA